MKSLKKLGFAVITAAILFGFASCKNTTDSTSPQTPTTHKHTWGEPEIIQGTCAKAGVKIYTCTSCGWNKVEKQSLLTQHVFGKTRINGTTGMGTKTCVLCDATFSGPVLKRGAKHNLSSTSQNNTDNQFKTALGKTGATIKNNSTDSNVNKIVFGLLSDEDVKSAVKNETVAATNQEIGAVDGTCCAYFDSESGTLYIVPSSEDADFFILNGSCNYLFSQYNKCTEIAGLGLCDTSRVTSMYAMFWECSALESVDVSGFDTSNVTEITAMFRECSALESIDVSGFDTSKVTNMNYMFGGCSVLESVDVSGFDTSKVENFGFMFYECKTLESVDVSKFNTTSATTMVAMFYGCESLESLNLSSFNTAKVTLMTSNAGYGMFQNCKTLTELDLSSFNTSEVTTMHNMFSGCTNLETIYVKDPATFVPDTITDESKKANMFEGCKAQELTNIADKQ